MSCKDRNQAIKTTLAKRFGRGNVRVFGSRGTAYGWVNVYLKIGPHKWDETRELSREVHTLIADAGIKLSTFYSDDGYSSAHSCINVSFEE